MLKNKLIKKRICKNCRGSFVPDRPMITPVCSYQCDIEIVRNNDLKKQEKDRKIKKEGLLTLSDYIQVLQKVVNTFVRIRDKGNSCISCDISLEGKKYDAGHYYPTTYQFLRFNEDNIHAQCVRCNRYLHGNQLEYTPRLEKKIGIDKLQWLHSNRHKRMETTVHEIKEKIIYYKNKIKELN